MRRILELDASAYVLLRMRQTYGEPRHEEVWRVPEINRGQLLRLAVAGAVATVGAGLMAGPAAAALPVPKPQGDDVGFLLFGAVGEMAGADWYERAARVRGFSAGERRRMQQGRAAKADHLRRINAVLGPDAISPGDFAASFPIVTTPNFPTSGKDVRQCCPVP
jgi:hypothetical protein